MTAVNPRLADAIAEQGIPLSADLVAKQQATYEEFGCPGFEGNPVAPDLCAGCGDARRYHQEAAS